MRAYHREQSIHFMTTLSIVNAIIQVGNVVAAAASGGSSSGGDKDSLKKTMDALRDLLLPADVAARESAVKRALKLLDKEVSKGPLVVTAKAARKNDKGRVRRSSVNGSTN